MGHGVVWGTGMPLTLAPTPSARGESPSARPLEPPESIATHHLARNSYDGPPKSAWHTLVRVT